MVRATPVPAPVPPRPHPINITMPGHAKAISHPEQLNRTTLSPNMGSLALVSLSAGCFEPPTPGRDGARPLSRPNDCWDAE